MVRRRFLRGNRSGMGHCIATILTRSRRIGYGLLLAALVIHDVKRSLNVARTNPVSRLQRDDGETSIVRKIPDSLLQKGGGEIYVAVAVSSGLTVQQLMIQHFGLLE